MKKTLVLVILIVLGIGVYWKWFRKTPLEKGQILLAQGDMGGAVELFLTALRKRDLNPLVEEALRTELSRAYLLKGSVENAEEQFRLIKNNYPHNIFSHLGLGFLSLSKGHNAFAIDYFKEARKIDPQDPRACLGLAGVYVFQSKHEKARQEYLTILNSIPTDRVARRGLAQVYMLEGLFQDSVAEYEQALKALPQDTGVRLALARVLFLSGNIKRGEEEVRKVLKKDKALPSALLLLGDILQSQGQRQPAKKCYDIIYRQDRRQIMAGLRLSLWHAREDNVTKAKELLNEIALILPRQAPSYPKTFSGFHDIWDAHQIKRYMRDIRVAYHTTKAKYYLIQALYADAEKDIHLALDINPHTFEGFRLMMTLNTLRSNPQGRDKWGQMASDIYSQHPVLFLDRAESALDLGRIQEALTYAKAAVAACPFMARAPAVLARVFLRLNKTEEARMAAERAVSLNPHDFDAQLAHALFLKAQKKLKEAQSALQRAIGLNPFSGHAHHEMGKLLRAQKNNQQAAQFFKKAARLEPLVYGANK